MKAEQSVDSGEVTSGLVTQAVLDGHTPRGLRVTWIHWDSGFRGRGLQISDLITAVNGIGLEPALKPGMFSTAIGQANDPVGWRTASAHANDVVRLTVLRKHTTLEITGTLTAQRTYLVDNRNALAPGGPRSLERDGFGSTWGMWNEEMVKRLSVILDGSWMRPAYRLDTRRELADLGSQQKRLDSLRERYPGVYAKAMAEDFGAAVACLAGTRYETVDLEYRELGAKRLVQVLQASHVTWNAILNSVAGRTRSAFPVPPFDQAAALAGTVVVLPPLIEEDWITDLGRSFAVAQDRSGAYFVPLNTEAFSRFYAAQQRFHTQVSTELAQRWEFLGVVGSQPLLLSVGERQQFGFVVELLAVKAGRNGELVIDLRDGGRLFAGEAELVAVVVPALAEHATAQQAIETLISAVKVADERTWRSLFATWRAYDFDGHMFYSAVDRPTDGMFAEAWKTSRDFMAADVLDVRVIDIEEPWVVLPANAIRGNPLIEQTVVWVDHVGAFNGEYRAFNRSRLHRRWPLQRQNGGPWRISELQTL